MESKMTTAFREISQIINCGIWSNFKKENTISDFAKFNLVYGWNGSGKTTLSRVFSAVQFKKGIEEFPSAEFTLTLEDGTKIVSTQLEKSSANIFVFNGDFIHSNINWNEMVKSILLVSEEKIDEKKKLDKLIPALEKVNEEIRTKEAEVVKLDKDISGFLSDTAQSIKKKFQVLDTEDNYYFNYNKTKLEVFIKANSADIKSGKSIITDSEVALVTKACKPDIKKEIGAIQKHIDIAVLKGLVSEVKDICDTSIVSATIGSLVKDAILQKWVEEGMLIHKGKHNNCQFCGNVLSDERLAALENHFSDEFRKIKERGTAEVDVVESYKIDISLLPQGTELYDEFREAYREKVEVMMFLAHQINLALDALKEVLKQKLTNPFDVSLKIPEIEDGYAKDLTTTVSELNEIINVHNLKTTNFQSEVKNSKRKLELHYSSLSCKIFDYFGKNSKKAALVVESEALVTSAAAIKEETQKLQKDLSNETLGASKFNDNLHKFLGRDEISLIFDNDKQGYKIIRTKTGKQARNLSEGEKTAIAFVYFITKLKEHGNDPKKSIVVMDDPVSSFDSNHLFHAYAFLRANCSDVLQLIVMTHNFSFFKIVRDWMIGKNKKDKPVKSRIYCIEIICDNGRKAVLKDANESLTKYNSEYHFLFAKLYSYVTKTTLNVDDAFMTANLARKLLECFLSFKFPLKRNDFNLLVEAGIKDEIRREKIYRFINKYSHYQVIDIGEDSAETVLGEGENIISEIFEVIKDMDPVHHQEMITLVAGL
jgi:wobble nucleotide-excising tRNase